LALKGADSSITAYSGASARSGADKEKRPASGRQASIAQVDVTQFSDMNPPAWPLGKDVPIFDVSKRSKLRVETDP